MPLRDVAVAPGQRQRQAARRARSRPRTTRSRATRPSSPSAARTRPTCSAGSTTSATPASTTRSAPPRASAIHANAFALTADGASSTPIPPELRGQALAGGARARPEQPLPGRRRARADDGSGPCKPTPDFHCDPTQVLPGQMTARPARHPRRCAGAGALVVASSGAERASPSKPRYTVELDNAFGLVKGADVKVAGVRAGTITEAARSTRRRTSALVDFEITKHGFGSLRSRRVLRVAPAVADRRVLHRLPARHVAPTSSSPARTIPVEHTASTIPADLLDNILRRPYRERLRIILDELGAGVARPRRTTSTRRSAARSPALRETDKVLAILARPEPDARATSTQQRGHGRSATSPATARTSARFVKEAERRRRDLAPSAAREHRRRPAAAARPSCASCARRWPSSAPPPTRRRPRCATSTRRAGQLTTLPRPTSARSPTSSRADVRTLGQAPPTTARPAIARRQARPSPSSTKATAQGARARQQPRRSSSSDLDDRNRAVEKDTRSPGRQGLHRLRGAPAVHLRPDRRRSTSSTRTATSSRSTCSRRSAATTRTPTSLRRKKQQDPASQRAASRPRPEPAGRHARRPDRHGRRRPPARRPRAAKRRRRRKRSAAQGRRPRAARARPARRSRRRSRGAARRRRPSSRRCRRRRAARRCRRRPAARPPASPTLPNVPQRAGAQSADPRPSSTTCSAHERPRRASVVANPVLVGAVTVLVVDRRRLPRLQRQQRAAVRADARRSRSRFANGAEPGQGQRGPRGRLPHRRGRPT